MPISKILKQLRMEHNKTQKDLANYLKITEQAYQRYEYGTREPKLENVKKLALFYNVTADYLLELTDKKD